MYSTAIRHIIYISLKKKIHTTFLWIDTSQCVNVNRTNVIKVLHYVCFGVLNGTINCQYIQLWIPVQCYWSFHNAQLWYSSAPSILVLGNLSMITILITHFATCSRRLFQIITNLITTRSHLCLTRCAKHDRPCTVQRNQVSEPQYTRCRP